MRVTVYAVGAGAGFGNKRAQYIAKAMYEGLRRCGVDSSISNRFTGVNADVAIAYGWVHEPIFTAYKKAGKRFAFWDLGYWCRRPRANPNDGYHRLAIDDWDTSKTMSRGNQLDRFARLGVEVAEPRTGGRHVLVAGMSEKAAGTHGFLFNEWEHRTKRELDAMGTGYPVVMRPKPSSRVVLNTTIEQDLADARILITHHSNAAIDAVVAGVPCYATKGVGVLASPRLLDAAAVREPFFPDPETRFQLLADVAYAQWTPSEMRSGDAWRHVKGVLGL